MVGKIQSSLGGRGERHHPLANRGRKPFINSEAEQRGSFRGVDLALKPYRPLSSRPVRRRLNTVHSRPPPPHPRRMHAALLARIPQVLDFKESPAGVWGKKREEFGWTCENVYVDFGEKTEQTHTGYKIALRMVRRDVKKKKNEKKTALEEIKAMKSPFWPGSKCYLLFCSRSNRHLQCFSLFAEWWQRGKSYRDHIHKMGFFVNVASLCYSWIPPCAFAWYVWRNLEQAHCLSLLWSMLSPQE